MSGSTVVANAAALVVRALEPPIADGWVLIEDGVVTGTGSGEPPTASNVIDASGCLVVPGLVCAHHHLSQGISRGIRTGPGLIEWLVVHYERWALMGSSEIGAAAALSVAQLLLSGCTTVATFEYLHPKGEDFVSPVLEVAEKAGIRLFYVRGTAPRLEANIVDRLLEKGVDVDRLLEPAERGLERISQFVRRPTSDFLRVGCGPTTPVLDDGGEFHKALNDVASDADAPIHLHYHPVGIASSDSALGPARRLGLLRKGNWFAHGSRLASEDIGILGEHGVGVGHCAWTSMRLGYEIPSLRAWGERSDRVAIGVDGAASNDRGTMVGEAQLAWYVQNQPHLAAGGQLSPEGVLHMVTEGAARTIGWPGLGTLTVGSAGDCAIFDLENLDSVGASSYKDSLFGFMTTTQGAHAKHVLVGGDPVVIDQKLVHFDHPEIVDAARRAREDLDLRIGAVA